MLVPDPLLQASLACTPARIVAAAPTSHGLRPGDFGLPADAQRFMHPGCDPTSRVWECRSYSSRLLARLREHGGHCSLTSISSDFPELPSHEALRCLLAAALSHVGRGNAPSPVSSLPLGQQHAAAW